MIATQRQRKVRWVGAEAAVVLRDGDVAVRVERFGRSVRVTRLVRGRATGGVTIEPGPTGLDCDEVTAAVSGLLAGAARRPEVAAAA